MKKTCFKCNQEKPLSSFYKHKQMADGHLNKCKECNKADVRENREKNVDYYRDYDRQRYKKDESVKKRIDRFSKKWVKKYPAKKLASTMVNNAVRDGRLKKPVSCEECHKKHDKLHGHHNDYAFPLSVRWLCPGCHRKWHRDNGEGANAF